MRPKPRRWAAPGRRCSNRVICGTEGSWQELRSGPHLDPTRSPGSAKSASTRRRRLSRSICRLRPTMSAVPQDRQLRKSRAKLILVLDAISPPCQRSPLSSTECGRGDTAGSGASKGALAENTTGGGDVNGVGRKLGCSRGGGASARNPIRPRSPREWLVVVRAAEKPSNLGEPCR